MTRFNLSTNKRKPDMRTYEGSPSFSYQDPRNELIALVATSFVKDKFYERTPNILYRMHGLIDRILHKGQYEFLWKLFYVARTEWNMRSIAHVLAGYLLSRKDQLQNYPKKEVEEILNFGWIRPDDMMETYAYYASMNDNGPLESLATPYMMRRATEKRFKRMSEFHAGKYPGKGLRFSLKNIMRMIRPKPDNEEQSLLFNAIRNEAVSAIDTNWRAKVDYLISTQGLTLKEAFTEVIDNMGIFAIVNNLVTFDRHEVDEELVLKRLADKDAILRSRILPFRFATAIKMTENKAYKQALIRSLEWSFESFDLPEGNYLIAVDTSGSMDYLINQDGYYYPVSCFRKMELPIETASLFGAILARKVELDTSNKVHLVAFGTNLERVETFDMGTYAIRKSIIDGNRRARIGSGTNGYKVFNYANRKDTPDFDYIFVLTDMQWTKHWFQDPVKSALTIFVNLSGYQSTLNPFIPQDRRIELPGLSDKIFDYLEIIQDINGMVKMVENFAIPTQ